MQRFIHKPTLRFNNYHSHTLSDDIITIGFSFSLPIDYLIVAHCVLISTLRYLSPFFHFLPITPFRHNSSILSLINYARCVWKWKKKGRDPGYVSYYSLSFSIGPWAILQSKEKRAMKRKLDLDNQTHTANASPFWLRLFLRGKKEEPQINEKSKWAVAVCVCIFRWVLSFIFYSHTFYSLLFRPKAFFRWPNNNKRIVCE